MIDPTAAKFMQFVPKSNTPYFLDSNGVIQNYVSYQYLSNQSTRYNTKIDHNFSSSNHLSARWTTAPVVGVSANDPAYPTNGNSGSYSKSSQYTISDTHIISPTIVNELRLAYTRADFSGQLSPELDVKPGRTLDRELALPSLTTPRPPLVHSDDN